LKANSGRYVGAGAYVGITKFYVQVKAINKQYWPNGKKEVIEMYGVKRENITTSNSNDQTPNTEGKLFGFKRRR